MLAAICFAFGADPANSDDPWKAVKALKSGSNVRIYKHGAAAPLAAQFIEATDDRLVYVVKNSQSSIDRKDVDRIEYRPPAKAEKTETHTTGIGADGMTDSWNSGKSWSRDGWQIVYQRSR